MGDQDPKSANTTWPLLKKTFCLITGASRGLGKVLAVKIGSKLAHGSVLFLLARDVAGLEATKAEVLKERPDTPDGLCVHVTGFDLSVPNNDAFLTAIKDALGEAKPDDFQEVIIVHNAASTGPPKRAKEYDDPADWTAHMAFNLTSAVCLNSVFFDVFTAVKRKLLINISSIAAIRPSPGLALYCAGKAARNLYFSTLASEEPEIVVLNYAPGPLDTEMYHSVIEKGKDSYKPVAEKFQKRIDDGMLLTCEATTEKLLKILDSGSFTSGDHIDYYDRP